MDGAILVRPAADGDAADQRARPSARPGRCAGDRRVSHKIDLVDDPELLDLGEWKSARLLSKYASRVMTFPLSALIGFRRIRIPRTPAATKCI